MLLTKNKKKLVINTTLDLLKFKLIFFFADVLVLYFCGQGIRGLPSRLVKKRRLGIFLDRVGVLHDLALVLADESIFPVAKLQTMMTSLHSKVERKVLILDCRLANGGKRK